MTTTTLLPTGTWQLDTAATSVTATVKKLGMITVTSSLGLVSGTFEIDAEGQVSGVEIVADASSYSSGNAKRDTHVLSDDFLGAETHPEITFRADAVRPAGRGYEAKGTVTIKGQTSPIDLTISDVDVNDERGTFTATAAIDRTTIGLDKMPNFVIGRTLQLTVSATATHS